MAERTWQGHWWEPGDLDQSQRQPGVLRERSDGSLALELIGGFDLSVWESTAGGGRSTNGAMRSLGLVLGLADGKQFTLLGLNMLHARGGFGRPTQQTLSPRRALIGCHLQGPENGLFSKVWVRIENSLVWLQEEAALLLNSSATGLAQVAVIDLPPPRVAAMGGGISCQAELRLKPFSVQSMRDSQEVTAATYVLFTLTSDRPIQHDGFDAAIYMLMDLITLASNQASGVISEFLSFAVERSGAGNTETWEPSVEVLDKHIHQAALVSPPQDLSSFLFTCADLDFTSVVEAWFPLRQQAMAACNVVFGLKYMTNTYTALRALNVAIAGEALHRALKPSAQAFAEERFAAIRKSVKQATTASDRSWVMSRIRNEPSFRERLLELLAIPAPLAVEVLINDRAAWVKELTTVRNGMAHEASHGQDAVDVFHLGAEGAMLIYLVLMQELGLSAEAQVRAVRTTPYLFRATRPTQ